MLPEEGLRRPGSPRPGDAVPHIGRALATAKKAVSLSGRTSPEYLVSLVEAIAASGATAAETSIVAAEASKKLERILRDASTDQRARAEQLKRRLAPHLQQ